MNHRHSACRSRAIAALLLLGAGLAHAAATTDKPGAAAASQASVPASAAKGGAAAGAALERCRDIRQKMDRLKAKEIKGWANQEPDLAWYSKHCR